MSRDDGLIEIVGQVRDGLAELKANVIAKWGRIPHVSADPTSPPDGSAWLRSDLKRLLFRANGQTLQANAVWSSTIGGAVTTAGTALSILDTHTTTAQPCDGTLLVFGALFYSMSVSTDQFEVALFQNGTVTQVTGARVAGTESNVTLVGAIAQSAGATTAINMTAQRLSGTGTLQSFLDFRYNRIHALFIPG